ncbi:MAG: UvrD-helicase domain-containing protein [Zetaproteobacteria bacterium]|nr:UvrD-helicase domain-containing protein [Zetaproteobacteria bacterium]
MSQLNPEQLRAAQSPDGPQLILAGAGSGKTRTIVHRIGHLIAERGFAPHRILTVTFTNKAAAELKTRLSELIGDGGGGVVSGTFHSISLRILRRHAEALGFPNSFQIIDSDDQKALIKRILKQRNIASERLHPSYLLNWIERCKHAGLLPEQVEAEGWNNINLQELYAEYQQSLRQLERMDFSDLILYVVILLRDYDEIAYRIRSRFDHILVDEYQDTNPIQFQWLQQLCHDHQNITVVGDDDQSIYGWRGADLRNILDFEHTWTGANMHCLDTNYRSTATILRLANAVIDHNQERHAKVLKATCGEGEIPQFKINQDEYAEAKYIVEALKKRHQQGVEWQEMAVLYRSNRQSLALEQQLRDANLPYQIIGGLGFFERLEIKDAMAYWTLLEQCGDSSHLLRIINKPKRGIGPKGQEQMMQALSESGLRVSEWLNWIASSEQLPSSVKKIQPFAQLLTHARTLPRENNRLIQLLQESGYIDSLKAMGELESITRIENIEALQRYIEMSIEQGLTPIEFMDRAALLQTEDEQNDGREKNIHKIALMSLHRAKGLEFDTVVLAGIEDGLLPHQRAIDEGEEGLAEECRLLYVGITRAKRYLLLTASRMRRLFGETHYARPSRFIKGLPTAILQPIVEMPHASPLQNSSTLKINHDSGLSIGCNVRHPTFGEGVLLTLEGSGDATRVSVQFQRAGLKRLMLKYAALERV